MTPRVLTKWSKCGISICSLNQRSNEWKLEISVGNPESGMKNPEARSPRPTYLCRTLLGERHRVEVELELEFPRWISSDCLGHFAQPLSHARYPRCHTCLRASHWHHDDLASA